MPDSEFKSITITKAGLEVIGTFNPKLLEGQKIVGSVFIGFLIIQNDEWKDPNIIVDGVAKWSYHPPDKATGLYRDWEATVPPGELTKGKARAIGTAVQVTVYDPLHPAVPPGVEMFNWCVPAKVIDRR